MKPTEHDDVLIQRTREALNDSAEQLDYASQLKLQRARAAALAALEPAVASKPRWWQQKVLWLAAVPAALAIVVALPLLVKAPGETDSMLAATENNDALSGFEDMELLAAEADLDTLAEMEFYQWLAEHPEGSEV